MSDTPVVQAQKEGWAISLIKNVFPGLQTNNSKAFATDVQFIYDWESGNAAWTYKDPLGRTAGDFASPHDAMLNASAYIKAHATLDKALQSGNYAAAKKALPANLPVTKSPMPSKVDTKTGSLATTPMPSLADQIGGTITDLPGAFSKDVSSLGDIGSLLGNHAVLIVLVVALILVLKK